MFANVGFRLLHRLRRIKPNATPLVLVLLHAVLTMASKPAARCGERIIACWTFRILEVGYGYNGFPTLRYQRERGSRRVYEWRDVSNVTQESRIESTVLYL